MDNQTFIQKLIEHALPHDPIMIKRTYQYLDLLFEWNQKMNLTAIDSLESALDKHILDCLVPTTSVNMVGNIADIGSGAGFPGMVWAIYYPNCHVDLIEPTGKRCLFLETVQSTLGLTNVTVINKRSEACNYLREHYDIVTARAVARLPLLLELCTPLLKVNGTMIALKGSSAMDELGESTYALSQLNMVYTNKIHYHCDDGGVHITLIFTKTASTPKEYPRNYSVMKKHPLVKS